MSSSLEPEIVHQSEGLFIRKNVKNRFTVASLYYYADPLKRDPQWAATVQAGMTKAEWEKEYLINYTAQMGERAFPEITEKRGLIVLDAPWPSFANHPTFWGGFDYGQRNPSSFHVYCIADGVTYCIWELYEPAKSIPDYASKMRQCPYWDRIKYIAADPTMWDNRTSDEFGAPASFQQLFAKYGVHKLLQGNNDEAVWLATMYEHWRQEYPTFKILSHCHNIIREFEKAVFADYSSEKLRESKNYQEGLVDRDNHGMDDSKYFMNSNPINPKPRPVTKRDLKSAWVDRPTRYAF